MRNIKICRTHNLSHHVDIFVHIQMEAENNMELSRFILWNFFNVFFLLLRKTKLFCGRCNCGSCATKNSIYRQLEVLILPCIVHSWNNQNISVAKNTSLKSVFCMSHPQETSILFDPIQTGEFFIIYSSKKFHRIHYTF